MIDVKELRIGNYLRDKKTGALLIVDEITDDKFGVTVLDRSHYPLPEGWQAEGVSLTPDVLSKCSLHLEERDGLAAWSIIHDLCLHDSEDGFRLCIWGADTDYTWVLHDVSVHPVKYKYLHQLQGLYFIMTGDELVVNL